MRKVDNMNIHVGKIFASQPTTPKVRIAILDTGCNLKAMCIANLYLSIPELKKRWKDWVSGSPEPVDEDTGQHGTATAALLLRVAKHAEVYIGRVIKDTDGLSSAQGAIAEVGVIIPLFLTLMVFFSFLFSLPKLQKTSLTTLTRQYPTP